MELRSKRVLPTFGERKEGAATNHSPISDNTVCYTAADTEDSNIAASSQMFMTHRSKSVNGNIQEEEEQCSGLKQTTSRKDYLNRQPFRPIPLRAQPETMMSFQMMNKNRDNTDDDLLYRTRNSFNQAQEHDRHIDMQQRTDHRRYTSDTPDFTSYQQEDFHVTSHDYPDFVNRSVQHPQVKQSERRSQSPRNSAFQPPAPRFTLHDLRSDLQSRRPATTYQYAPPNYYHHQSQQSWRPNIKLPTFNGKSEEWQSFWIQFQLCARRCNFDDEEFATQLLMSLKGSALTYATSLGLNILQDANQLSAALKSRYNLNIPAQTHRASLYSLRKSASESLQDYASRVQTAMLKAYPDIEYTDTFTQLTIQQFLSGYNDQDLATDVQKFNPKTLAETIDKLTWLESCKQNVKKRQGLRQVSSKDDESDTGDEEDGDLRRINGKRFVTEERLMQYERDLQRNLQRMFRELTNQYFGDREETATRRKGQEDSYQQSRKPIRCYNCNEEGHLSYDCKSRSSKDTKKNYENTTEEKPLNLIGLSQVANTQSRM